MKPEFHLEAFEERKETIIKWGVEVRGIENSQRIVGDNASKAITELLSAYLHKKHKINEGFQINHIWFKSERVFEKLPEFENKRNIVGKMIELERLCERLSYGVPKPLEKIKEALKVFEDLEKTIKRMI
jgi:hypothetical protein